MAKAGTKSVGPPEIRLLGELALLRGGVPVPLPASKKTRALLGYLVATGRSHGRERLCDLLWEGPDDPRGALRWSLSKLRPLLDDDAAHRLVADRDHASFETRGARVDLHEARALHARGLEAAPLEALEAAANGWNGHFLEGLELPGCVRFYAWCVAEREQARALHVAVLDALISRLQSSPERALKHARALVTLDPLAESSHAKVIRLLAALGRPKEAIAEYERCRRTLAEQIGERPSADLERLRAELQPRRIDVDAEPAAVATELDQPHSGLVGREREQRAVAEVLARPVTARAPNALLFVGESGMGKSRMLEELARRATARGTRVLSAKAFEAEGVRPYGLWVDALRTVPRAELAKESELKMLFPDLGASQTQPDRTRLFEAVRGVLLRLAPVVVVLDDLQWADEGSMALLHFAARALAGEKVVLGCGARAGALGDNPAALAVVRALEREGRVEPVTLEPLSDEQTKALARQLHPSIDVDRIVSMAEGNPLYTLELSRALKRGDADANAGLARLARQRLDALTDGEQTLLPWAAALGRTFDVAVLTKVSGLQAPQLLDALERLERHGVVRATAADLYDFSHDLLRQAAYARMSEPRRRLVHRLISVALESLGDVAAGDVAQHAALAGDHERAAAACVAAGLRCRRLCAWSDAHAVARRGLEHAAHLAPPVRLGFEVELLGLLGNQRSGEQRQEVDQQLARVAKEAAGLGLTAIAAQAFHYRSVALFQGGDVEAAVHYVGLARRTAADHEQMALRATRCMAVMERDMGEVGAKLQEASARPLQEGSLLDYHWAQGLLHRYRGDSNAAARELEKAAARAARDEQHWERAMVLLAQSFNHLEGARGAEAVEAASQLAAVAVQLGEGVEGPAAKAIAALVAAESTGAWGPLDQALEAVRLADGKATLALLANFAAELAERRGDPRRARMLATAAREAAAAVKLVSQEIVARAILARAALATESADAPTELEALRRESAQTASARAAAAAAGILSVKQVPAVKPKKG